MKIPSSARSIPVLSHAFTVLAALVAAPTVHADCPKLIRVPEDSASINAAVAQVCAGTTAEIVVGPGTWMCDAEPVWGASVLIRGVDRAKTTLLPGRPNGTFTALSQWSPSTIRFVDVTLRDGGSADEWRVSFERCDVVECDQNFFPEGQSIIDSRFIDCNPTFWGSLYLQPDTTVARCSFNRCNRPILLWGDGGGPGHLVQDCMFQNCYGRNIHVRSSCCYYGANRARIERCTFDDTSGGSGPAIEFWPNRAEGAQTPVLEIVDCEFFGIGQGTGTTGGAVRIDSGQEEWTALPVSSTTITGSTFTGCSAGAGGAIYVSVSQPLSVTDCTFTNNSATAGSGGAILQKFGGHYQQFAASNCSFVGNTATGDGGALKLSGWSGNATLSDCSFQSNSASGDGGAVNVDRLSVSANNCEFLDNTSAGEGGAYFQFIGTTSLHGCLFGSNSAARTGAVHLYYYNNSQIQSCTFTNNTAGHWGTVSVSGSYCSSAIDDCIFAGNSSADVHALAVVGEGTSVTLSSTSICGGIESAWFGPVTDGGGNCVVESCADTDTNGIPDECQVVSVPGEYKTIQDAIDTTPKGEFRIVSVAAGTYTGPFALGGKDVLIRGAGAATTVLQLDGQTLGSVVRFDGGESSSSGLDGVTVRGAISGSPLPSNPAVLVGGGVIGLNSAAGIRNCVIESNVSSFGGGAYLLGCTSVIENTVFRNNIARADGGAAQFYGGAITMNGCTVTDNLAVLRGGGLHIVLGNHVVSSTTVSKNHSNDRGGGLSWAPVNSPTASLDLISCDIEDNTAFFQAGGILADTSTASPSLAIETSSVCGNLPRPNIVGPHDRDSATVVCDCFGDLSEDGVVNGVDVAIILSVWGTDGGGHPEWDVTRDGTIDGADLAVVLSAWGECAP